jgi:hypothetical protein
LNTVDFLGTENDFFLGTEGVLHCSLSFLPFRFLNVFGRLFAMAETMAQVGQPLDLPIPEIDQHFAP